MSWYLQRLLGIGLASAALATAIPGMAASQPHASSEARVLLSNASDGEIFALEDGLARIRQPALMLLARAQLAAAHLDLQAAHGLVDQYFAQENRTSADDTQAWAILAAACFAGGDYACAAKAGAALQNALTHTGDADDKAGAAQIRVLAQELTRLPGQQVLAYAPIPAHLRRDKMGLPRVHATINGVDQEAVFDTGANLSVVSMSTARKLQLQLLGASDGLGVGAAANQAVPVQIGVAREFRFAGLVLSNVPFLVLDDRQLEMPVPGGYRIDAILGFPVLRALQRFRVSKDMLTPARSTTDGKTTHRNVAMVGNDVFVRAVVGGVPVSMHLDSGASKSSLSARFAREHPEIVKGLATKRAHVAGAGGSAVRESAYWPNVRFSIGGRETVVPGLPVETSPSKGNSSNLLGETTLDRFEWWSIDFNNLEFKLSPALAGGEPAREAMQQ